MNKLIILLIALSACAAYIYVTQNSNQENIPAITASSDIKTNEGSKPKLAKSTSTEGARVYIIEPKNGAVVSSPVLVKFGIDNMSVAPAGTNTPNSGHHHLLINLDQLPDLDLPLPANSQLVHFGGGQTETSIELPAGSHRLQLILGDYLHIPHDKPVISDAITITVQ